jgi:EmrB/QacA subfamily drug resistance transporter
MAEGGVNLTNRQVKMAFAGVMAGMFLSGLDQNILNTALPTIVNEFKGGKEFAWVATAYLLTSTAATPLFGKLSDQYGRKRLYQIAILIFMVGSLLCGLAQSIGQLILARGLQGVGGGGLFALAFAIVGDLVPPRERGRYIGVITSVFTLTSVIGPIIGGVIVDHTSWRWIFIVNVPVGFVALAITSVSLRLPWASRKQSIDYIGAGLLIVSVSALVLGVAWSGTEYGWLSWETLGLETLALVLGYLFVLWEARAPEPIVPLRLFRVETMQRLVPMVFVAGAIMFGANAFVPLFYQAVTGVRPTWAGLLMTPFMVGVAGAAIVGGRWTTRTGRYKRLPIIGFALVAIGLSGLSFLRGSNGYVVLAMSSMLVAGTGVGLMMPTASLIAQNAVEPADLGTASSLSIFFRQLGGVIGLALFGAVLNARVSGRLDERLIQQPLAIRQLPPGQRDAALDVFTSGLTLIFALGVPLALIGLFFATRIPELPLRTTTSMRSDEQAPAADFVEPATAL